MRKLATFLKDERGAVAPLVGVALVSLVGVGGLAYDVSRGYALRAELENAVDAAALAGATQLDGKAGAQTRAKAAAKGVLVDNAQILANTAEADVVINDTDIDFLSDITTKAAAAGDGDSNFIRIYVAPRSLGAVFGAFAGALGFQARAHAIAGYGAFICKVPPLFICNPDEPNGNLDKRYSFTAANKVGKAFTLTPPPGGNNAWGPGNYGFIDVGNGASDVKEAMGSSAPTTQCFGGTVRTKPGNVASGDDWFNMRFDLYNSGGTGGEDNNPVYAPAMNTIIGVKTVVNSGNNNPSCDATPADPDKACNNSTKVASGYGLPIDCNQNGTLGSGTWNAAKYFASNHGTLTPSSNTTGVWNGYGPAPTGGAMSPTRYQVYKWELAILSGAIGNPGSAFNEGQAQVSPPSSPQPGGDYARPQCNKSGAQTNPDRRIISAAVVNCNANSPSGASTVVTTTFVDFFLIAPAANHKIYGEFLGNTTQVSTAGRMTAHYAVRLYE